MRDRRVAAQEAVGAALRRLVGVEGWLRAFIEVGGGQALRAAAELDHRLGEGRPLPRLMGVPMAVKGRAGMCSVQTRRLQAAGAIAIGLTSTPRGAGPQTWGYTARGPTRNPWRGDLSPGGSSAGSAAAVAAGVVPLATGADGAGSARIPAAWCGIFGYKPSNSLLAGGGLSVAAPLARHPADLAAWAEVVLGSLPPAAAAHSVAWSAGLGFAGEQLDDEVVTICHAAARAVAAELGLNWSEQPVALADPGPAWNTLRDPDSSPTALAGADRLRTENNQRLGEVFAQTDLLMTPTTPRAAHGHDGPGAHMSVALTWAFNLSGHPAISVPAGRTATGAPVGLQIIARPRADRQLLALARRFPPAPIAPTPARRSELS